MIVRLGAGWISFINLGELSLTESRQQAKKCFYHVIKVSLQRQPQAPRVIALMPGGKLRWLFLSPPLIRLYILHSAAGKTDYTITHRKSLISECRSVFCHNRLEKELPLTTLFR